MDQIFSTDFWQTAYTEAGSWLIHTIPSLFLVIVLMIITLWIYRLIIGRLKKIMIKSAEMRLESESMNEKEKRINTLNNILLQAGKIAIFIVFLLMFLKEVGLDIGPVLASAGIVGLAVGFGAQELVRDFISGFFMLLENQVREGDVAIINDTGGLVEKIALRTITLRDFSGVVHIFQNGKINTLSNMTKEWSAMVFDIGVAYREDIDKVTEVIRTVGTELQNDEKFKDLILEPMEIFGVDKFGDSAVVVKARIKTKPIQQWTVGREFNGRLKKAFDNAGIEIPFPHRTIFWGDASSPFKISADQSEADKINSVK